MAESTEKKRLLPLPKQVRAARGLLGFSQEQLATAAGVGRSTVERYEQQTRELQPEVLEKIADALERRGIIFTNGNTPGVTHDPSKAIIPV